MRIRTAIFGVYVVASAIGLAGVMALVLRDVRLRYVESMRRTMGDTAAYLAVFSSAAAPGENWIKKLPDLPENTELLRVFACDLEGRVVYDSAKRDVGQVYIWPMTGGGPTASENYSLPNVAEVGGELRVAARVRAGGEVVGWVGVGRPLTTLSGGIRAARIGMLWPIGVIALGMVALGWLLAARLTRSLERLTVYALNVRDGRPTLPPQSRAKEIAELSRAFEEMRDALEGRQHVERYTQTLAHEVKAPLAAIRGAAELMDESMPAEQRQKFLGNIRHESARIQQIIDRLLELSSLEARKTLRQTETVPVRTLLEEAVAVVQPAAALRQVKFTVLSGDMGNVRGERVLLREALVNLLHNALEFSPVGGEVTVRAEARTGRIVFVVEDQGAGVPDYALSRVFERFYSLPRPGTDRKSTGLGLALVKEIAHLHGGDAALANRAQGGAKAEFWVKI